MVRRTAKLRGVPTFHRLGEGARLPGAAFVALAPGADVPLLPLDLPPGLKGAARERVARRQMADLFGSGGKDVELRPAPLGIKASVWDRALVVQGQMREAWRDEAGKAGSRAIAILPDYLALPCCRGCWTLEPFPGGLRARLGVADGFTAEADLAETLLAAALETEPPKAILWLGDGEPPLSDSFKAQEIPVKRKAGEIEALGLPAPKMLVHGELALDLARDPGAELADMRRAVRPLLVPLVMGVLALAFWSGSVHFETGELRYQALEHRRNAEKIVRDTMIPTGPLLDIRAQVSKLVEDQSQAAEATATVEKPLEVFKLAGNVLTEAGTTVSRVSYQPGSGLVIDLQVTDFAALDSLVAAMRGRGIDLVVAQSSTAEGNGVEATLALASSAAGN